MTPTPQEPPSEGPERDVPAGHDDDADVAPRGWIDPDDRLWRHPSELGARSAASSPPATTPRHSRAMVLIGATAAVAAVVWTIVLLSPASDRPPTSPTSDNVTDAPLTTSAVRDAAVPVTTIAAARSMVELRADTSHGTVFQAGVAVAEGGLVATTADDLAGVRRIWMIDPSGAAHRASVVAVDGSSDVALVSVPADLPVAPFADDATLTEGSPAVSLNLESARSDPAGVHSQVGSVTGIGTPIVSGWAKGMPAITSSASAVGDESGDPLLNQSGEVIGILYSPAASPVYLPSQLVLGVADDLRSNGRVSHGWLGVKGANASGSGGAQVAGLMSGSPATDLLHPGEVIVAMGSVPIRSMAELRARLYVLAPKTTIALSIVDGSTARIVDVTLSASP